MGWQVLQSPICEPVAQAAAKPHPEIWVPAVGSKDSLKFAADNHYTYLAILVPRPVLLRNIKTFRDMCEEAGYTADPTQVVATATVHVAETDKQARLEVEAHFMSMLQNSFGSPFHDSFPPGHVTSQSLRGMMSGAIEPKRFLKQLSRKPLPIDL